jgi:hypothetical protein
MTGIYLLEGTKTIVSRATSAKVSTGVSSALVGALSSVPIGGSVSLGVGSTWDMTMEVADPHVWAAQFRLLDARFIKVGKNGVDGVKLPITMGLYRDVMSVNTARGGGGPSIELGLEQDEKPETQTGAVLDTAVEDDQEGMELEEYETRLEQAIKVFEKAPKHFLQ